MTATRVGVVLGALALAPWFNACTTTQAAKPELPGGKCAYLAPSVCSELVAGDDVALRYRAPNVDWKKYSKVFVSPVLAYGGDQRKIPAQDSQFLANYMHEAFEQQFASKGFQVVADPGPGVIKVQAAIVDPEAAVPILRTVSMVVPQARALATLKLLATDSYPFVGGLGGELEATDSQTGELLAAGVDRRIGGGNITTAAQWKWGDAENVMDHWAELVATRLRNLHDGTTPN
jgi:hypothetical protein